MPWRRLTLMAILLSCAAPARGHAQGGGLDTAEVRTAATSTRSVPPDRAAVTLQFSADGSTPTLAGAALAARADSVRRRLMALDIARDSMLTGSTWYWWNDRLQVITNPRRIRVPGSPYGYQQAVDSIPIENGWQMRPILDTTYRAQEIIEVHLDPGKVGAAIDAALAMRITQISNIRFSATDVHEAQLLALREATARAREQAEAIASASGSRLGRIVSMSTMPDNRESYGTTTFDVRGVVDGVSSQTQVTAPAVTVSMTVYGRWQLLK